MMFRSSCCINAGSCKCPSLLSRIQLHLLPRKAQDLNIMLYLERRRNSERKDTPEEQPKAAEEMTTQVEYMGTVRRTTENRPRRRGHGGVLRSHVHIFRQLVRLTLVL